MCAGGLGFKDFELFNLALLAKQAWRILETPESLSARILKSIYFPHTCILGAELGSHPSQIWRSLIEGRDVLKQGLIRRIGNGSTTDIWAHNWIPRDVMMRPHGCRCDNPPNMVSELIDHTAASWNRGKLEEVFLSIDIPAILSIPLCISNISNSWAWNFEKNGCFSVRSAYRMMVATKRRREEWLDGMAGSSSNNREEGSWKTLWRTEVPGKIGMFLWRLAKHSLPTEDVRAQRNMSTSKQCALCGAQDSWRHSLLECSMARCVWALVDGELAEHLCETTEPSSKQWLFSMLDTLSHAAFIRLAVTMWAIWWARRCAIHDGIFQSPAATNEFIQRFIADLDFLSKKKVEVRPGASSARARPKAPPAGYAKIHVDVGVARSRLGGSAVAVCRDSNGNFLGSSAIVISGVTDVPSLEALAAGSISLS